mmetsp:Transcript_31672/g.98773  ORF Transcript_31672/g.98773 Transcript_31672/m.98773 type:complete len:203 (-) Transcript_31672:1200-1808(-)
MSFFPEDGLFRSWSPSKRSIASSFVSPLTAFGGFEAGALAKDGATVSSLDGSGAMVEKAPLPWAAAESSREGPPARPPSQLSLNAAMLAIRSAFTMLKSSCWLHQSFHAASNALASPPPPSRCSLSQAIASAPASPAGGRGPPPAPSPRARGAGSRPCDAPPPGSAVAARSAVRSSPWPCAKGQAAPFSHAPRSKNLQSSVL